VSQSTVRVARTSVNPGSQRRGPGARDHRWRNQQHGSRATRPLESHRGAALAGAGRPPLQPAGRPALHAAFPLIAMRLWRAGYSCGKLTATTAHERRN